MIKKTIDKNDVKRIFAPLPDRTNKGQMGRVLVVCGSYDESGLAMCGAAYFAAKAAYRTGAGIVEIFTPRDNYSVLASLVPEAIFSLYGCDEVEGAVCRRLTLALSRSDAVVIGCGLGKSPLSLKMLACVLEGADCPLVVDADALNILSEETSLWDCVSEEQGRRVVITPHPGEMSRLCGMGIPEILADTVGVARDFAKDKRVICLLKDHNTVISDGESVYINQSGNAGMASAGMGDVLAGIIGSIAARERLHGNGNDYLLCAAVGAYLHGAAGDAVADKLGQYSLMASDLLAEIPAIIG